MDEATSPKNPEEQPATAAFHPASFFERLKAADGAKVKRLLGTYIARELIRPHPTEGILVFSGTTPCFVAEQIMATVDGASIFTASIPVLWMAMRLNQERRVAHGVVLRVIGGEADLFTGLISTPNFRTISARKLIYSPRSLTTRGIEGNRNTKAIQAAIAAAQDIIMPVSDDKIGRPADIIIKHLGHIAKESRRRRFTIILPPALPSVADAEPARSILASYQQAGVKVIRIPQDYPSPPLAADLLGLEPHLD